MAYAAVTLDLFETVLMFDGPAPTMRTTTPGWRDAMRAALEAETPRALGTVALERFLDALVAESRALAAARGPEQRETPIAERYRRALQRVGIADPTAAERLAAAQLRAFAARTVLPPANRDAVAALAARAPVAIISNFDDAATVHGLIERHELAPHVRAVTVSVEHGRRKPHPAVFRDTVRALGATPDTALHTGDTPGADVAGAREAGLDAAWLNANNAPYPADLPEPTYVIHTLDELVDLVEAPRRGR